VNEFRATLPRTTRLRGAAQFTGAFQGRYRSKHLLLLTRPGGSAQSGARLGIIIGRHQVPRAVERARLKRIIREAFRQCRHQLGRVDVVVRYRDSPERQPNAVIRSELSELLEQAAA
jgi:ribonuclease P protein component